MKLTHKNGAFIADCSYEEKSLVDKNGAGFFFHWGDDKCKKNCEGCKAEVPKKTWWTPHTERALQLAECADESAQMAFNDHRQDIKASRASEADLEVPAPDGLEYMPFQVAGIAYANARQSTLIGDHMGLGKTIQALGVINSNPDMKQILVVCPASLRINWLNEAKKWLVSDFEFHVVESQKPIPDTATFIIVNYDRLKGDLLEQLLSRSWDLLIVDEAHFLKNPNAQRTQKVLGKPAKGRGKTKKEAVPGLIHCARRALFLTGTPFLNKPKELWSLLHALDPVVWSNFFQFAMRYCDGHKETIYRGKQVWNFDGASRLEELQDKLRSTVMVRRLKKDVLTELPAKTRQVIDLPLNGCKQAVAQEQASWERHEAELARLRDVVDLAHASENEEDYQQAVERLNHNVRIAFSAISKERHRVAVAKIPAVLDHIDRILDEGTGKILVFAHHHDVVDGLMEHYGNKAVKLDGRMNNNDKNESVRRFQEDKDCKIFVGSIKAAGVGLTLTAASLVVFAELDWVAANVTQAEDRSHRLGQTNPVLIQHLVLDGSLDARMAKTIVHKQQLADRALDLPTAIKISVIPEKPRAPRPKKYPVATPEQKQAAATAMQQLAGMCDGANSLDGAGFSRVDVHVGHSLAKKSTGRPFTNGETWLASKLANKYRRQLPTNLLSILGGNNA